MRNETDTIAAVRDASETLGPRESSGRAPAHGGTCRIHVAMTIRDLRRARSMAPGGPEFPSLVRAFAPLVFGSASLLAPYKSEVVERVFVGVFHAFAFQWRRLPRNTVIASWLLRSTWLAVRWERRRLKLPMPSRASAAGVSAAVLGALVRMRRGLQDAVVLGCVVQAHIPETARALRRQEARAVALRDRGLDRLRKALQTRAPGIDLPKFLAEVPRAMSTEFECSALTQVEAWSPRTRKSGLVRGIRRAWRWVALERALRRVVTVAASGVCLLILLVVAFVWSLRQGHLTRWFVEQSSRRLAKEMPEVAEPARPWPPRSPDASRESPPPPRSAAELYGLTNVWTAQFSFTPGQWKALGPSRVPPIPNLMRPDGMMQLRNPKARRSGLAGVLGLDFNWARAHLEFAGVQFSSMGVRYRGNGTYVNSLFGPKQPFKVDLDKFVRGQDMAGIHTLNFVNAIPDNSYLHDVLAQHLFRELGVPGPRTAYAYLTLDVPGLFERQPLGLYVLVENVDADFAADRFGSPDVPIFKPVTTQLFEYLGEDWSAYADIYDLKTRATPRQLDRLVDFARLLAQADDPEFARRVPDYIDLDEFAGFLAGNVLISSYDGFLSNGQNFYMCMDPRTGRLVFIPWDHDHGWGEFGYVGTNERRERACIWRPSTYENRFLDRMLKVEAFRHLYRRHLERALEGPFTVDRLYSRIDRIGAIIRPAVAAESDFRLKRFDLAISTNWLEGPRDGAPEGPRAPVHQIKRFIAGRAQSIRDQLEGKTQGEILMRGPGR